MKKLLALTAGLLMAVSFVSCGDNGGGNKSSGKNDSDKVANDFAEAVYSSKGGETYYSLYFPDEYIEELKDNDEWEDYIDYYNDDMQEDLEGYKVNVKDVKKGDELTDGQLAAAESYFDDEFDCDVKVSKGYEYKLKFEAIDTENDEKETDTETICVVKLDEGWKVIDWSAENLEDEYA